MRGRKPVPTVLRALHGNPGKRPMPKHEPKPVGDLEEPLAWFSEDQKAGWTYALAHSPPSLLRRIDRGILAVWIVAEDLHRQAAVAQSVVGLLVRIPTKATAGRDEAGVPAASPYINIINQQAKVMLKAASELGFTPVSRPRAMTSELPPVPAFAGSRRTSVNGSETAKPMLSIADFIASNPDKLRSN
jgi:phage terminase small subunit